MDACPVLGMAIIALHLGGPHIVQLRCWPAANTFLFWNPICEYWGSLEVEKEKKKVLRQPLDHLTLKARTQAPTKWFSVGSHNLQLHLCLECVIFYTVKFWLFSEFEDLSLSTESAMLGIKTHNEMIGMDRLFWSSFLDLFSTFSSNSRIIADGFTLIQGFSSFAIQWPLHKL